MSLNIGRWLSVSVLAVLVSVAFSARAEAQLPAEAQNPARAIEGTWFVQLTFRNCATGAVLGTGFGMNTFVPGGMMLGTPSAPPAASRTGHGVWTHVEGPRFYNRMGLFNYNPQTGAFTGIRIVTRNIELGEGGDVFTSNDNDQLYDPTTFAPIGGLGCVTGVGRRVP